MILSGRASASYSCMFGVALFKMPPPKSKSKSKRSKAYSKSKSMRFKMCVVSITTYGDTCCLGHNRVVLLVQLKLTLHNYGYLDLLLQVQSTQSGYMLHGSELLCPYVPPVGTLCPYVLLMKLLM